MKISNVDLNIDLAGIVLIICLTLLCHQCNKFDHEERMMWERRKMELQDREYRSKILDINKEIERVCTPTN